jgi:hypothetical protein
MDAQQLGPQRGRLHRPSASCAIRADGSYAATSLWSRLRAHQKLSSFLTIGARNATTTYGSGFWQGPPGRRQLSCALERLWQLGITLFRNQGDLEQKLDSYQICHSRHRYHAGLAGITPDLRSGAPAHPIADLDSYRWRQHCNGLFQTPAAA